MRTTLILECGLLFVLAGCRPSATVPDVVQPSAQVTPARPKSDANAPFIETIGLHNLRQITERIYAGSEPHGDEGFASLERLGIKTIVSVDGAKPNLELARQHGLRYVHIPIGYDGVPAAAGAALARLVREADGPFYIHCHHGKHRGPAAAAIACIAAGDRDSEAALQILADAGTSRGYAGLWRDVRAYVAPATDAELPALVEVAEVGSLAAAMAQVDRSFDNLKLCRDANWNVPPNHPDLVPVAEALLLHEGLFEAARNLREPLDEQFTTWLTESVEQSRDLLAAFRDGESTRAAELFQRLEQACLQCHAKYRDR